MNPTPAKAHRSALPVGLGLAVALAVAPVVDAQDILIYSLTRYGVLLPERGPEGAFDAGVVPTIAVQPGAFAAPLAVLQAGDTASRIRAAYTFGILAGRGAGSVLAGDAAAAGDALIQMMGSKDRKTCVAGARVSGWVFGAPLKAGAETAVRPAGLNEALFALLNRENQTVQLAAMDALGYLRELAAVPALTERYRFYRLANKRALAGGALEALARIGDPSSVPLVRSLVGDRFGEGRDPTALAVAFARERFLNDGSAAMLKQALGATERRAQALRYLAELGAVVP